MGTRKGLITLAKKGICICALYVVDGRDHVFLGGHCHRVSRLVDTSAVH